MAGWEYPSRAPGRDLSKTELPYIDIALEGAKGDGTTNNTVLLQQIAYYAATKERAIRVPENGVFAFQSVYIPTGCLGIFGPGILKGIGTAANAVLLIGSEEDPAEDMLISVRMDMTGGDLVAMRAFAPISCDFTGNRIYGFGNHATLNHYGILLDGASRGNVISKNRITGYNNPTQRGLLIDLLGGGQASYGGYFTGAAVRATDPAVDNIIVDNILIDGSYAINLLGAERNLLQGNICRNQNHRSIYLANTSYENIIDSNGLFDYLSSAVLLGYSASANTVSNNKCRKLTYESGEAAININTGAVDNKIHYNDIVAGVNYGVYLGPGSVRNSVKGNKISNHYLAAIAIENDWISPRPAGAVFSRPNYGAPDTGDSWSFVNVSGNIISGNEIGAGYSGRNTAAISVAQIDAGGETSVVDNEISDNSVLSGTDISYNLYVYADTAAKLTGLILTGNKFRSDNTFQVGGPGGLTTWHPHIGYFGQNRNFDELIDNEPISFADGDTTPSVLTNSALPDQRVFSLGNYTTPTNLTNFDDGINGQVITVRMSVQVTIIYNTSLIRTKGLTNIAPQSANAYIRFIRQSGIWYELSRSF